MESLKELGFEELSVKETNETNGGVFPLIPVVIGICFIAGGVAGYLAAKKNHQEAAM